MTTSIQSAACAAVVALTMAAAHGETPAETPTLTRVLTLAEVPPASTTGAPTTAATTATDPAAAPDADEPEYGITGNWGGLRDQLANHHVYVGGRVDLDVSKVLRGGLDTRAWPVSYLLDINVTADIGREFGQGGVVYLDLQSHDQSRNGDASVGDIQGFDNIGSPRFVQISQLWYKQEFADLVRVKIGKIDANSDASPPGGDANDAFSLMEHGLDFLHTAAAYSPSIFAATSYPSFGPAAEVFVGKDMYLGMATFYSNTNQTFLNIAGHPEAVQVPAGGMFSIAEAGARWKSVGDADDRPGHAAIGGWYHNGTFPLNSGAGTQRGTGGGYAFIDQSLFHEEKEGKTVRDFGMFFSAGISDRNTSPMDENLAMGLTATGFMPGRPDDCCGVCASWVHLPAPELTHPFELATEIFYKIQLTSWASVKPDFQYIVNPSGTLRDAAVVSVRAEIAF